MKIKYGYKMVIILYIIMLICTISQKQNFHVDEIYTYGLSNNSVFDAICITPEAGKIYDLGVDNPYLQYMTVQPEQRFNYQNVWKKNSMDVHPPLYYTIVHTISSFFPQTFSVWFAGTVNIICAALSLLLMAKILQLLDLPDGISVLTLLGYVLTAGILNTAALFRMYLMMQLCAMTLLYMVLQNIKEKINDKLLYICLFAISVVSLLTQYFMIIFIAGICGMLGLYALIDRNWKKLICGGITMILAVGAVLAIYPVSLYHIFGGYQGTRAISNFAHSSIVQRLTDFTVLLNKVVFGKAGILVVAVIVASLIAAWLQKKHLSEIMNISDQKVRTVGMITGSSLFYFLVVAKVAPDVVDRYVTLIFPMIYMLAVYAVFRLIANRKVMCCAVAGIISVCTICSWLTADWSYLYKGENTVIAYAESNSDADCVCVYQSGSKYDWKLLSFYKEISGYKTVRYIPYDAYLDGSIMPDITGKTVLFIVDSCDETEVLTKLEKEYPDISTEKIDDYTKMGNSGITAVWSIQ